MLTHLLRNRSSIDDPLAGRSDVGAVPSTPGRALSPLSTAGPAINTPPVVSQNAARDASAFSQHDSDGDGVVLARSVIEDIDNDGQLSVGDRYRHTYEDGTKSVGRINQMHVDAAGGTTAGLQTAANALDDGRLWTVKMESRDDFIGQTTGAIVGEIERPHAREAWSGGRWDDTASAYWIQHGWNGSDFMDRQYLEHLQLAIKDVALQFPDRQAKKLVIGDSCTRRGDTPGHPAGSHSNGRTVDLNYYTNGEHNFTQGRPPGFEDLEMWQLSDGEFRLNKEVFDWERNWALYKRIKQTFPQARICVDAAIKDEIMSHLKGSDYQMAKYFLSGDPVDKRAEWHHHQHAHVMLGSRIDSSYVMD